MANLIQIKRATSTSTPATLSAGELAYSNSSQVIFIGSTDAGATVVPIGGVRTPGILTANQSLVANTTSGINQVIVQQLTLQGNATTSGVLSANGGAGTAGFVLTSAGSNANAYWQSLGSLAVNSAAQYTWTNVHSYNANVVIAGGSLSQLVINSSAIIANTLGLFTTGTVNTATFSIGTSFIANTTNVYSTANASFAGANVYIAGTNTAITSNTTLGGTNTVITSNTTVGGANAFISANTTLAGTNTVVSSNASFLGANLYVTGTNTAITSNTTLAGTNTVISSNLTVTGTNTYFTSNVTVTGTNSVFTSNASFLGANVYVTGTNTYFGANVTFNANTNFGGANHFVSSTNTNITSNTTLGGTNTVITSNALFTGSVSVQGNLTVTGTLTTIDTINLQVKDNFILTADQNNLATTDVVDFGIVGVANSAGGNQYYGMGRVASANVFQLFNTATQPGTATITGQSIMPLQAFLIPYGSQVGAFVVNAQAVAITANNTVNVNITANSITLGTPLAATSGGTGFNTYTAGDMVYSSATNVLAKLAIGTSGYVLQVNSTNRPEWNTLDGGTF